MITSTNWNTDYILTVGDNNYGQIDLGHANWETILGARYGDFIQQRAGPTPNPYPNQTSSTQRFFPTVGNHDSTATGTGQTGASGGIIPGYVDYFHTDPDNPNGRLPAGVHNSTHSYYDLELPISGGSGTVRLFAMDSDSFRTDASSRAAQESWLQQGLENSTATWNFVYMHHAPYSSASSHGSDPQMQLPFQQWGAHAVLAGHDHTYERLRVTDPTQNEMLYFVSGLGGNSLRSFGTPENGSDVRYSANYGASRITVTDQTATFEFLSLDDGSNGANGGSVVDTFVLDQSNLPSPPDTLPSFEVIARGATWDYFESIDTSTAANGTAPNKYPLDTSLRDWFDPDFNKAVTDFGIWKNDVAPLGSGTINAIGGSPGLGGIPGTQLIRQQTVGVNRPTFLMRSTFEVSDANAVKFLDFDALIDDGAIFYINGTEVHRLNVAGAYDQSTYATSTANEDAYSLISIDPSAFTNLLHDGTNVLAIELKNRSTTSSDIGFDVALNLLIDYEADFDRNGVVDSQDLSNWELEFGTSNGADADADDDGDSDGFDFLAWQRQFGSGGGAPLAAATPIPEPTTLTLAALSLCLIATRRRRKLAPKH